MLRPSACRPWQPDRSSAYPRTRWRSYTTWWDTTDPTGFDAGKKVKGNKRHILVDTEGLPMHAIVHPADIQDRDGGVLLLSTSFGLFPFLGTVFADGGYQGPRFGQGAAAYLTQMAVEIV